MENKNNNNPSVTEVIDAVLTGDKDPKFDINHDGKVDIADVTAAVDNQLNPQHEHHYKVGGVKFTMIEVEGGTYTMGKRIQGDTSTDNKTEHEVTLDTFLIGKTEVTQALWKAVMGKNPAHFKGDNNPVEYVTWEECQTFIAKLNEMTGKTFRLPTEAEWEYAARGGRNSEGYRYSGSDTLADVAWCNANSGGETHPVGEKNANELGLYDMTGNVKEWCNDWYYIYSAQAQTNPQGPATGSWKVYRGGSYDSMAADCFLTKRFCRKPDYHDINLGLRLAL